MMKVKFTWYHGGLGISWPSIEASFLKKKMSRCGLAEELGQVGCKLKLAVSYTQLSNCALH